MATTDSGRATMKDLMQLRVDLEQSIDRKLQRVNDKIDGITWTVAKITGGIAAGVATLQIILTWSR